MSFDIASVVAVLRRYGHRAQALRTGPMESFISSPKTTENKVQNRAKQSPTYKIVAGERRSIRTNRRLKPDHWLALGIPRKAGGQSGHPAFRAGKSWLTRDGIRSLDVALGSHLKP